MPAGVVTGVNNPALNFGLTLLEVKPVSDFHFWPEIRVRHKEICKVLFIGQFTRQNFRA